MKGETFTQLMQRPHAGGASAARLLVRGGVHAGAWMSLREPEVRIGRGASNHVVLTDVHMPLHAAVLRRGPVEWDLEAPAESADADADSPKIEAMGEVRRGRWRRRRWILHGVNVVLIDRAPGFAAQASRPARRTALQGWGIAAGSMTLVASGLILAAYVVAPAVYAHSSAELSLLKPPAALPDVRLAVEATGPVLHGYVENEQQWVQLEQWTSKNNLGAAQKNVRIGSRLAAEVRGLLPANEGIDVGYTGAGRVRVTGTTSSAAVKKQVQSIASDLGGRIAVDDQLAFSDDRSVSQRHVMPVRIANVMHGDQPYFQSEEGVVYTVGATLPDGAEVVAIEPLQITFRLKDRNVVYPLDR